MSDTVPAFVPPSRPIAGFFAELRQRLGYRRERRRWVAELRNLATLGGLDALLGDIGLDRGQLDILANGPADAGRQLEPMIEAAGGAPRAIWPAVLRDAQWTCIVCRQRSACARWLRSGAGMGGDRRCPNAKLLHS